MIKVFGLSEQNQQLELPVRKPNEDYFGYDVSRDGSRLVAVMMDGIPVPRNDDGSYPDLNGSIAARIATEEIIEALSVLDADVTEAFVTEAFMGANRAILQKNLQEGRYELLPPFWIATVGCALFVEINKRTAIFGYIGDPVAFHSTGYKTSLLAEDQLAEWILHFEDPGHQKYAGSIRMWQDIFVRNRMSAFCHCGIPVSGWGGLTGEREASNFLKTQTIPLIGNDRFILASDAITVLGGKERRSRRLQHYMGALEAVRDLEPKIATQFLIQLARTEEVTSGAKSDDATFVVADVEL